MCSPSEYVFMINIVSNPQGMEFKQIFANHWVAMLLGVIFLSILVLWGLKSFQRFQDKKRLINILILSSFAVLIIGFAFLFMSSRFSCGPFDIDYYTNEEFIEKMDSKINSKNPLMEMIVFYPEGKIDLSDSEYTFNCYNEECKQNLIISEDGKKITAQNHVEGLIFNCDSEKTLNIFIRGFYKDFNISQQECENNVVNHMAQ